MASNFHLPVMLNECLDALAIRQDGVYLDATLGRGGHSAAIAQRGGKVIAIDRDAEAIAYAQAHYPEITVLRGNYAQMDVLLSRLGITKLDGILYDLGVSSPQIDQAERGFSYMKDARLDMRMDIAQSLTAYDVVNRFSVAELMCILRDYGEERYSFQIANAIARQRGIAPIETTLQLVEIIKQAMPPKARREAQHPAMRVFQALRISVNDELTSLQDSLYKAIALLNPNGRLAVISFHSLEDRIVKTTMKSQSLTCVCPPKSPICQCNHAPTLRLISKRAITAPPDECIANSRAKSAKLRVAEKI
ncbi:MAG: 16S rRNA (cytosine(1402)-N(4))-methyltransferase RsmH [Oscillospiraceae bacterium]|nr:16S rRNA (cytosine(1402)-N(4))-methyltransferase RsmH [Oscillospiraceae bacterium]